MSIPSCQKFSFSEVSKVRWTSLFFAFFFQKHWLSQCHKFIILCSHNTITFHHFPFYLASEEILRWKWQIEPISKSASFPSDTFSSDDAICRAISSSWSHTSVQSLHGPINMMKRLISPWYISFIIIDIFFPWTNPVSRERKKFLLGKLLSN